MYHKFDRQIPSQVSCRGTKISSRLIKLHQLQEVGRRIPIYTSKRQRRINAEPYWQPVKRFQHIGNLIKFPSATYHACCCMLHLLQPFLNYNYTIGWLGMKIDGDGSKIGVWTHSECGCVPVPPRTKTLSALQPTKLIRLRPNRPINDAKLGQIKVQQRWQVNRNKFPSRSLENRSVLSARKGTDYRIVTILNLSLSGSVWLSVCVVVYVSVASQPNIQFTNVTDEDHASIPVANILITRCYMMLKRTSRRRRKKEELDQQPRELEHLERWPWACCVFQ